MVNLILNIPDSKETSNNNNNNNLNILDEYLNNILDVSDSEELFVEKFCKIYTFLESSEIIVPILYKNTFIYIISILSNISLKGKEEEYYYITVIFPNESICFVQKTLLSLATGLHKILQYFQRSFSLNRKEYTCNFELIGLPEDFLGYYSNSYFRVKNG